VTRYKTLAITTLLTCLAFYAAHSSASDGYYPVNSNAVLGGAIGGGAGAAIGSAVGGRNGAIIGSALGAGTGVAIATPQRRETHVVREYRDHKYYGHEHRDNGWHRGHYKHHYRHGRHHHDE